MLAWVIYPVLFAVGVTVSLEGLWYLDVGPITLSPSKIATAILLLLVGVRTILAPRPPPWTPRNLWLILLYTSLGLSSLVGISQGTALLEMVSRWQSFVALFLFYFLVPLAVTNVRELRVMFWSVIVGGVIAGGSSVLGVGADAGAWDYARTGGLGGKANQSAANMLLAIPLAYALFAGSRSAIARTLLLGSMALLGLGVILSYSRSGFLASVAIFMLWMVRFGRHTSAQRMIPVLVVLSVALLLAPAAYFQRIAGMAVETSQSRTDYRSNQSRLHQYEMAARAFISNPVAGVGVTRFSIWAHDADPTYPVGLPVHNSILQVASDQGILGLVPFLAMLILTWTEMSRVGGRPRSPTLRDDPELAFLRTAALCTQLGFMGFLIVGMFQPFAWEKGLYLAFALATTQLGLARARVNWLQGREARAEAAEAPTFHTFGQQAPSGS